MAPKVWTQTVEANVQLLHEVRRAIANVEHHIADDIC